jgi:hypothetical protein
MLTQCLDAGSAALELGYESVYPWGAPRVYGLGESDEVTIDCGSPPQPRLSPSISWEPMEFAAVLILSATVVMGPWA